MKKSVGIIIQIALAISYMGANYLRLFSMDIVLTSWWAISFALIGIAVGSYLIFELIMFFVTSYIARAIPQFSNIKKEFKTYIRLMMIPRNIVLGAINVIFLFYPLSAYWGMAVSYLVVTTLFAGLGYLLFAKRYDKGPKIYFRASANCYCVFLILYTILGGVIW